MFPDAVTVTVPDGGHLAFLEEPEWFQREVESFVERVAGTSD
ncbi:alpha/beta fold hydrolase [Streptomyces sp. NPDC051740]